MATVKTPDFSLFDAQPWLGSYAVGVPHELPENSFTSVHQMVSESTRKMAKWPAVSVCFQDGTVGMLTFAELDSYADAFANWLRYSIKLKKGDRVALQMPNCIAYPVVMLGVWKAGGVLVNVNPQYTSQEMNYQLQDSGARVLVVADVLGHKVADALPGASVEQVVMASVADFLGRFTKIKMTSLMWAFGDLPGIDVPHVKLMEVLARGPKMSGGDKWVDEVGPDDLAVLQYTGGTTGVSKGAMLSHSNLIANMEQGKAMMLGASADGIAPHVFLTALPLYHAFAFGIMLAGVTMGAHNVLIPNPRPVSNLKAAFDAFDVNVFTAVNTLLVKLLEEDWFVMSPPENLSLTLAGGTALQDTVAQTWIRVIGAEPFQAYGLTETSPGICMNPPGSVVKRGTVGVPMPSTRIRLVTEAGAAAGINERGEVVVSGPQVMQGYWDNVESDAITDGWFRTGDIGTMDSDGYISIVDRIKDVIIVSGFNVYPNEVEDAIVKHADVLECSVIGVPDEGTDEKVVAFVVPRTTALTGDSVLAFCRQHLTNYKMPVDIVFTNDLPYSMVGKVLRRTLRKRYKNQDYVRHSLNPPNRHG